MAGFKETVSKGITTINVTTNNFMEATTIKTHISTLESECKALYEAIGETVYDQWLQGEVSTDPIKEQLELLKKKREEIEAELGRLKELQKMKEDILGKKKQQTPAAGGQIFCMQCGGENSSAYIYCCKCGAMLVK